jgi:hypothetical protein
MKEYQKLAREFLSEHDDGPEAIIEAYESAYLKAREMARNLAASYAAPPETLKEFLELGEKEV